MTLKALTLPVLHLVLFSFKFYHPTTLLWDIMFLVCI